MAKPTPSEYKRLIEYRINALNTYLAKHGVNITYQTHYAPHYGGWDLFYIEESENSALRRGFFGFDARKSSAETLEYLEGILKTFDFIESLNK